MSRGRGMRHFCSLWLSVNSFVICLLSRPNAKSAIDIKIGDASERFFLVKFQNAPVQVGLWVSTVQTFETRTLAILKAGGMPTDALIVSVLLKLFWLACQKCADSFIRHFVRGLESIILRR